MVISSCRMVVENCLRGLAQWTRQRAAAGVQMATATEARRDARHVQLAFAAQREADAMVGQLAQQNRRLDAADADGVIHDAFAIFLGGSGARSCRRGSPRARQACLRAADS